MVVTVTMHIDWCSSLLGLMPCLPAAAYRLACLHYVQFPRLECDGGGPRPWHVR